MLKIGDAVEWTSQAAGRSKPKEGLIVGKVGGGKSALDKLERLAKKHNADVRCDPGTIRRETTYFVLVQESETRKPKLYRPRTKHLKTIQ